MWRVMIGIMRPFFNSPEKGAATGLYIATAKELENTSGKYFKNKREVQSTKISYDLEVAKRLWELSEAMIKGLNSDGNHLTVGHGIETRRS